MRILGVLLGVYFLLGLLTLFGVKDLIYYDELLHAVSAQKMLRTEAYQTGVHEVLGHDIAGMRVPLMVLYYVGPQKSYMLATWFSLFGSSLESLRIFTLFCGAIYLGGLYLILDRYVNRNVATLSLLLLIIDPSFLMSRVLDWGPLATQDIWKMVLLGALLRVVCVGGSALRYGLIGLASGLVLWEKLNAWWFVGPMWIVLLWRLWKIREERKFLWALLGGFVVGMVPLFLLIWKRAWFLETSVESFVSLDRYRLSHLGNGALANLLWNYASSGGAKLDSYWSVMSGNAVFGHIAKNGFGMEGVGGYLYLGMVYFGGVFGKLFEEREKFWLKLFGFLGAGVFVAQLVTPHANAIHHVLVIYPFVQIIAAVVLVALMRTRKKLVLLLITFTVMAQLYLWGMGLHAIGKTEEVQMYWNGGYMRELVQKLESSVDSRYVALDWGISLPVGFLSNGRIRIEDLAAFYEAKCQVKARMRSEGMVFVKYDERDMVFETYYRECLWVE